MEVKIRHKKFLNIVCYYFCFRWIDRQFCQLQSKTWLDWVYQKEGTFCAPANLEKQKAALVDKISNVGRERIAKRSRHSKSVSVRWMHYDSVKKNMSVLQKLKEEEYDSAYFKMKHRKKKYC